MISKQYVLTGCLILALAVAIFWYIRRGPEWSGPSANDLRVQFTVEIPAYLRLMSFDVQASAPIGDKVEPAFKARFHASVSLESDTYKEIHREGDVVYVESQLNAGDTKELYGIAHSTLKAGSWHTAFTLESDPLEAIGKPIGLFEGGRVRVHVCNPFDPIVIGEPTHDEKICKEFTPPS